MPMSFVHQFGSPGPDATSPRAQSSGGRDGSRLVRQAATDGRPKKDGRSGGAAQRVRQKARRPKQRNPEGSPRVVERTCIGCGGTGNAAELLRLVLAPTFAAGPGAARKAAPAANLSSEANPSSEADTAVPGESLGTESATFPILVDLSGKLPGRGAWVHPQPACLERACPRGLSKAFETSIRITARELSAQVALAAERRLVGLLLAASRSRHLVFGRDAVKEVLEKAPLVLLATDAQAVAKDAELQRAGVAGKVVCWSTKENLGHWLGRSEVGVVAILEASIAEVMRRTIALAGLTCGFEGSAGRQRVAGRDEQLSEVR